MKIKNAAELREAKQKRKELADQLAGANQPEMTPEEMRAWESLKAEFDSADGEIRAYEAYQERSGTVSALQTAEERGQAQANRERMPAQVADHQPLRLFRNLGEQLRAIRNITVNHTADERLHQLDAEARALGASEGVGADGGFAVQTDFAGSIFDSAVQDDGILARVDTYDISAQSNGARWLRIDESDVSNTVYGGVQVYWDAEAVAVNASKPKIKPVKLDLEKLMGIAYATEELLQDTSFMSQLYTRAFSTAIQRKLAGDIIAGDGVGKCKGILSSGSLVTVAKESGQAAKSILFENIAHMWGRLLPTSRGNAVWLMHPDVEEILPFLHLPVGTGGVPVYLPPSGAAAGPYATLYGKPVIPSDHCSALGGVGDVLLADLKEYQLIRKGGVQAATSIHVQFLTAENCFRFIFRANGMPKQDSALTIKNSSNKRSAFVTLAARA